MSHAPIRRLSMQDVEPAGSAGTLADDEIHLWLWQSGEPVPPRRVSALARERLEALLRRYSQTAELPRIERGEHGKPHVRAEGFPHFNISHAGRGMAFAFSEKQELGIDIEAVARRHGPLELAARFFTAAETEALSALAPSRQGAAFVRLWTCKEAVLKALGHGISFGLDRLRFGLDAESRPDSLQAIAAEAGSPAEWQLWHFDPAQDHVGTLAWRGPPRRVRLFRLGQD